MNAVNTMNDRLLRTALRGNGVFSAVSGAMMVVASRPLAEFIGLAWPSALLIIRVLTLLYALDLFWFTSRETINMTFAWLTIILDVAWVVASVVLLLADPLGFTVAGKWFIGLMAEAVALFAVVQWLGVRRLKV